MLTAQIIEFDQELDLFYNSLDYRVNVLIRAETISKSDSWSFSLLKSIVSIIIFT
jgi:hypothetical protein